MPDPVEPPSGTAPTLEARWPVLLVPVQIQTRFTMRGEQPVLRVRIYPDQFSIDRHDPRLTQEEIDAGMSFWTSTWRAGADDVEGQRAIWARLVDAYGPRRAAWIARDLTPSNADSRPRKRTPDDQPLDSAPRIPPPSQGTKPSSYARAVEAAAMPDRWLVTVYSGGTAAYSVESGAVRRPLVVGPAPAQATQPPPASGGFDLDPEMRWLVEFDEALAAGMAVEIPISAAEAASGFDRIVVTGLRRASLQQGAEELARILDGHHYGDGLALVPQGTPTNNTEQARSGYTAGDPGYRSFDVECGQPLVQRDGALVTLALGLPAELFQHVAATDGADQANARAMTVALWGPTLGYFLLQLMDGVFSPEQEDAARTYFLDRVRGRGPIPAFRVGATPYGILPVTSLAGYEPDRAPVLRGLVPFLRRLLPRWLESAAAAPHVTLGDDPDQELVAVLGQDASARNFRIRDALGSSFVDNYMRFLGVGDGGDWLREVEGPGRRELDDLGFPTWEPRLIRLALTGRDVPYPGPIVAAEPSETDPLPPAPGSVWNYVAWLRHASIDDIRAERYPGGVAPDALLYRVLRQTVLLEYANQAYWALQRAGILQGGAKIDAELVGFARAEDGSPPVAGRLAARAGTLGPGDVTPWEALAEPVPGITQPGQAIGDYLRGLPSGASGAFARLGELFAALDQLAPLPSAELERLFTETLDLVSTRLDAWITSLATDRLLAQRATAPDGIHVGAFGFVHDIRPEPQEPQVAGADAVAVAELDRRRGDRAPDGQPPAPVRQPRADNGGFVHAPSVGQAATSAILRQGYLTHRQSSNGRLLAIDLSSKRVRTALWLLDGVRQGQSLGALLGYRFEQALHDATPLAQYIEAFRLHYPLVPPDRVTPPAAPGPSEALPLPNVVNGLSLQGDRAAGRIAWDELGVSTDDRGRIEPLLDDLAEALDSLADLSLAESVFQITRGNFTRAGGMLDALARGERAPEPEVLRTPRGGIAVTYRLVLLLLDDPPRSPAWPKVGPRATAEPRLDAWLSSLLPDPDYVRCQVTHVQGAASETFEVKLSELGVGPLDVLALAHAADEPQQSELEQRILYRALQHASVPEAHGELRIQFGRDEHFTPARTFPELLALARAARDLVGGARALRPADLVEPGAAPEARGATLHAGDLRAAALAAIDGLEAARAMLAAASAPDAVRAALVAASGYGVLGSIPASAKGASALLELLQQRDRIVAELAKRRDAASALEAAYQDDPAKPQASVAHSGQVVQALFGESFVVCPQFAPPGAATLAAAFAGSPALLAGAKHEPERWLQRLTHVRPAVSRLDLVQTLAHVVGGSRRSGPTLAQLPPKAGSGPDRWLALPLEGSLPEPGRVALAAWIAGGPYNPGKRHAGLVLDEWVERIPSERETTGVSFHYTQPRARAPQALLLAVSPDTRPAWDESLLLAIINETIDLARVRTVDLDALGAGGQILPALYFAFNPAGDTVSANLKTAGS
jgi:hypothetical protein